MKYFVQKEEVGTINGEKCTAGMEFTAGPSQPERRWTKHGIFSKFRKPAEDLPTQRVEVGSKPQAVITTWPESVMRGLLELAGQMDFKKVKEISQMLPPTDSITGRAREVLRYIKQNWSWTDHFFWVALNRLEQPVVDAELYDDADKVFFVFTGRERDRRPTELYWSNGLGRGGIDRLMHCPAMFEAKIFNEIVPLYYLFLEPEEAVNPANLGRLMDLLYTDDAATILGMCEEIHGKLSQFHNRMLPLSRYGFLDRVPFPSACYLARRILKRMFRERWVGIGDQCILLDIREELLLASEGEIIRNNRVFRRLLVSVIRYAFHIHGDYTGSDPKQGFCDASMKTIRIAFDAWMKAVYGDSLDFTLFSPLEKNGAKICRNIRKLIQCYSENLFPAAGLYGKELPVEKLELAMKQFENQQYAESTEYHYWMWQIHRHLVAMVHHVYPQFTPENAWRRFQELEKMLETALNFSFSDTSCMRFLLTDARNEPKLAILDPAKEESSAGRQILEAFEFLDRRIKHLLSLHDTTIPDHSATSCYFCQRYPGLQEISEREESEETKLVASVEYMQKELAVRHRPEYTCEPMWCDEGMFMDTTVFRDVTASLMSNADAISSSCVGGTSAPREMTASSCQMEDARVEGHKSNGEPDNSQTTRGEMTAGNPQVEAARRVCRRAVKAYATQARNNQVIAAKYKEALAAAEDPLANGFDTYEKAFEELVQAVTTFESEAFSDSSDEDVSCDEEMPSLDETEVPEQEAKEEEKVDRMEEEEKEEEKKEEEEPLPELLERNAGDTYDFFFETLNDVKQKQLDCDVMKVVLGFIRAGRTLGVLNHVQSCVGGLKLSDLAQTARGNETVEEALSNLLQELESPTGKDLGLLLVPIKNGRKSPSIELFDMNRMDWLISSYQRTSEAIEKFLRNELLPNDGDIDTEMAQRLMKHLLTTTSEELCSIMNLTADTVNADGLRFSDFLNVVHATRDLVQLDRLNDLAKRYVVIARSFPRKRPQTPTASVEKKPDAPAPKEEEKKPAPQEDSKQKTITEAILEAILGPTTPHLDMLTVLKERFGITQSSPDRTFTILLTPPLYRLGNPVSVTTNIHTALRNAQEVAMETKAGTPISEEKLKQIIALTLQYVDKLNIPAPIKTLYHSAYDDLKASDVNGEANKQLSILSQSLIQTIMTLAQEYVAFSQDLKGTEDWSNVKTELEKMIAMKKPPFNRAGSKTLVRALEVLIFGGAKDAHVNPQPTAAQRVNCIKCWIQNVQDGNPILTSLSVQRDNEIHKLVNAAVNLPDDRILQGSVFTVGVDILWLLSGFRLMCQQLEKMEQLALWHRDSLDALPCEMRSVMDMYQFCQKYKVNTHYAEALLIFLARPQANVPCKYYVDEAKSLQHAL